MLAEESLSQKFLKKGMWLYIFTFLGAPLGYIIKIILSRDLSVPELGLFYGVISLITLLSAINDLWCTESLNYFLPKYLIKKDYGRVRYLLGLVFRVQIFTSFFVIFLLFFGADFLAHHHFSSPKATELIQIFSLFFLGTNLVQVCSVMFSATQNTKLQKAAEFLRMFFTVIFIVSLFLFSVGNLINYAIAWIWSIFLTVIITGIWFYRYYYFPYLHNIPTKKDPCLKKRFFHYAIPTFLTANISLLLSQIDAQMVTGMLGTEAHGYYSNYLSIMTLPFLILSPMLGFLFPVFSELYSRNQTDKILNIFQYGMLLMIILSIWISAFMWQNAIPLAETLFGKDYRDSGIILQYSIPFLIFNLLNQLHFQLLSGTGQAWARTVSFSITLPINIILNYFLIQKLGVYGSALAVGISWIPLYVMTFYYTKKYIKIPPIFPIIANGFSAIIAFVITKEFLLPSGGFKNIFLAMLIYFLCFLLVNSINAKKILSHLFPHRS